MKAISLRQPWAWLVCAGYKLIEFRSRSDPFRGECYIHVSKTIDKPAFEWIASRIPQSYIEGFMVNGLPAKGMFVTGKIIGKVTVVDCLKVSEALKVFPDNIWLITAGESLGKRAFILESPVLFSPENYIPCRGKVFPLFFKPEVE